MTRTQATVSSFCQNSRGFPQVRTRTETWAASALAGSLAFLATASSASEFRGLWVDAFGPGFFNAQQVRKLANDCRKYNFNAALVQMRRRGDAF